MTPSQAASPGRPYGVRAYHIRVVRLRAAQRSCGRASTVTAGGSLPTTYVISVSREKVVGREKKGFIQIVAERRGSRRLAQIRAQMNADFIEGVK